MSVTIQTDRQTCRLRLAYTDVDKHKHTRLSNFADMHSLFFGHESEHGEDSKTSVNTGATVEHRQHRTVPVHTLASHTIEQEKNKQDRITSVH